MQSTRLQLSFQDVPPRPDEYIWHNRSGFSVGCVRLHRPRSFDFTWKGAANYLALHDTVLADGEIDSETDISANCTDLRDRPTFVPHETRLSGWSELAGHDHGYMAVYFAMDLVETEVERPLLNVAQFGCPNQ